MSLTGYIGNLRRGPSNRAVWDCTSSQSECCRESANTPTTDNDDDDDDDDGGVIRRVH